MPYEYRKLSPAEREVIVNDHRTVMNSSERRAEFEARLLNALKEITEDLIVRVILSNHYQVLINIQSLDDVSATLKHLHGTTSREWNLEDNLTGKRRVWYKFADTYIRNDSHLRVVFNYIDHNPAKHGYVSDSLDWPWSSLRMYYEDTGQTWLQEQWNAYEPPADFGKGWDDNIKND